MSFFSKHNRLPLIALLAVAALAGCKDKNRTAYALTSNSTIVKFETDTPKDIETEATVSGLATGETLLQIDYRPANKAMYGLVQSVITTPTTACPNAAADTPCYNYYVATVNPDSGVVAKIGTGFVPTANATLRPPVAMDINPMGDYMRIIDYPGSTTSTTANNIRVNLDTGALIQSDSTTLIFNDNDTNSGETPELVAIAHSNSVAGASSTTLYGLELTTQSLVRVTTSGQLYTLGAVNHGFVVTSGFDIVPDGDQAFVAINTSGQSAVLYKMSLTDGSVGDVDQIGGGYQILSLAVTLEDHSDENDDN